MLCHAVPVYIIFVIVLCVVRNVTCMVHRDLLAVEELVDDQAMSTTSACTQQNEQL